MWELINDGLMQINISNFQDQGNKSHGQQLSIQENTY